MSMWHCEKCLGTPGVGVGCVCAARPAASAHPIPQPLRDTFSAIEDSAPSANGMQVFTQMRTAVQSFFQAQPAASAEPSDEELARLWRQVSGRETLRPDSVAMTFARALLSRYGRPAGECFYVDAGHLREVRNGNDMPVSMSTTSHHGMVPLYTAAVAAGDAQPVADHKFYPHPGYRAFCQKCGKAEADHPTAPVPAQKADDAKLPAKIPEYEAVGGEYPSNDSYQEGYAEGWNAAIDAAMQRESGGGV